jgi:broad specificity phosphatase PhoE
MPDNPLTTIYIVRHGQTTSNLEAIVAGITDTPLTEQGQQQAHLRGKDLASVEFDVVFSSDLIRAKNTAEIISLNRQLAVNTTELLRERNFGDWEGRPEAEIQRENQHLFEELKKLSAKEKLNFKFNPGYESGTEIIERFLIFLREVAVTYSGKALLVISHGSIMRSVLMHLGFGSYDDLPPGCIDNTGYFVLESDGVDFFIKKTVGIKTKA